MGPPGECRWPQRMTDNCVTGPHYHELHAAPGKAYFALSAQAVSIEVFCAYDASMKGPRNQRFVLNLSGERIGNRNVIHFKSAPKSALVIGFGFLQIGQSPDFRAFCGNKVALRQNDLIDRGGAESIFFLLGVERFLLQLTGLARRFDLSAVLRQRNVTVADIEKRGILELLHLRFDLALDQESPGVVGLRRAVAQRQVES